MNGNKDVSKIRQEMEALENEKICNPGFSEMRAMELAPYMHNSVPTLFKIIYTESEKDYTMIANVMLNNLEQLYSGEINADKATETLGRFLFNKLVKPNLPDEEE